MKTTLKRLILGAMALTLVSWLGCDGGDSNGDGADVKEAEELTAGTDVPTYGDAEEEPGDGVDLGYPAGPYGTTVGGTVADHAFGDPAGGGEVRLSDLYQHPEKKLLLLTSGAGWCSACKQEAVELKAKYEEYGPKGLEIWSTLFQDANGNPPSEAFWNTWKAQLNPTYPLLLDTTFVLNAYFNPDSAPMNMLIRLDTMEILFLETGFDPGKVETEIKNFLE